MKDIDAYIDAAATLIDLEIAPAYRANVRLFLQTARDMAALLDAAPLDEDEPAPAPVYLPPEWSA